MAENIKKPKKKGKVLIFILIICIAVISFSAYKIISLQMQYKAGRDEYESLREYTVPQTEPEVSQGEQQTDEIKELAPVEVDSRSLKEINPDFVAWLYLGAENISYPVVHYKDNDYYLHRTFEGQYNFAGTLFVEAENSPDLTDPHTIIYGHNMKDQSMFGKLKLLSQNEDYKKDDTFWLLAPEHDYKYKMFSMKVENAASDAYTLYSGPTEEIVEYIKTRNAESIIPFEMPECDENSRIVTLSTCWGSGDTDERFIVQGILVYES